MLFNTKQSGVFQLSHKYVFQKEQIHFDVSQVVTGSFGHIRLNKNKKMLAVFFTSDSSQTFDCYLSGKINVMCRNMHRAFGAEQTKDLNWFPLFSLSTWNEANLHWFITTSVNVWWQSYGLNLESPGWWFTYYILVHHRDKQPFTSAFPLRVNPQPNLTVKTRELYTDRPDHQIMLLLSGQSTNNNSILSPFNYDLQGGQAPRGQSSCSIAFCHFLLN